MADSKSTSSTLELNVPTYIPLPEAAQKHGLSEQALTQLIQAGKIEAVQLPSGELPVASEKNAIKHKTKNEIIAAKFGHLRGKLISINAASRKYGILPSNFTRWVRSGYIEVIKEEDRQVKMDEADVAYCEYVYTKKKEEYGGNIAGVRIFDEYGNPYQLKYPDLSEKRRNQ